MELIILGTVGIILLGASTWFRLKRQAAAFPDATALRCSAVLPLGERGTAYTLHCDTERFLIVRTPAGVAITPLAPAAPRRSLPGDAINPVGAR